MANTYKKDKFAMEILTDITITISNRKIFVIVQSSSYDFFPIVLSRSEPNNDN
jgi:hypothetical protein